MAQKLTAGLPIDLDLAPGFVVQLTAVDPTSGNVNTSVNVSNVAIIAAPVTPGSASGVGPDYSPLFIPLQESPGG